jgi:hypothetical protein
LQPVIQLVAGGAGAEWSGTEVLSQTKRTAPFRERPWKASVD